MVSNRKYSPLKSAILFSTIVGLLTLHSCSEKEQTESTQMKVTAPVTLVGKVYGLSDPIDTANCERIPVGTDFFQTLLFVDDSLFIKIIYTCCPNVGEEFASAFYYSGKYKMDDKELTLNFDPKMAIYYVKDMEKPNSDTLISSVRIEITKTDYSTDRLARLNCKNFPYFRQMTGEWKGQLMVQSTEVFADKIAEIKKDGVWEKLFSQ